MKSGRHYRTFAAKANPDRLVLRTRDLRSKECGSVHKASALRADSTRMPDATTFDRPRIRYEIIRDHLMSVASGRQPDQNCPWDSPRSEPCMQSAERSKGAARKLPNPTPCTCLTFSKRLSKGLPRSWQLPQEREHDGTPFFVAHPESSTEDLPEHRPTVEKIANWAPARS